VKIKEIGIHRALFGSPRIDERVDGRQTGGHLKHLHCLGVSDRVKWLRKDICNLIFAGGMFVFDIFL
jgi:hypothetical protein